MVKVISTEISHFECPNEKVEYLGEKIYFRRWHWQHFPNIATGETSQAITSLTI